VKLYVALHPVPRPTAIAKAGKGFDDFLDRGDQWMAVTAGTKRLGAVTSTGRFTPSFLLHTARFMPTQIRSAKQALELFLMPVGALTHQGRSSA